MTDGNLPKSDQMTTEETSILHKVRSRVSDILPRWFSPSRAIGSRSPINSNNNSGGGDVSPGHRRRRLSVDEEEDVESDSENGLSTNKPIAKKMKIAEVVSPSTSTASSSLKRHHISATNSRFTSSTPTSIEKRRKLIGHQLNSKASPYNLSKSFTASVSQPSDEIVFPLDSPNRRNSDAYKQQIKHRKSIHQNSTDNNKNEVPLSDRKRLNIPFTVDRSISEPPTRNAGVSVFGKSRLNVYPPSSTVIIDENDDDELDDEISINDIDNDDERNSHANGETGAPNASNNAADMSDASSDGEFPTVSVPPRATQSDLFKSRLLGSRQATNARDRLSSFMGNRNNLNLSASTGELNFSKHLDTDKSLFTERNVHSAMSTLNRPSFNASLYGSSSSLNSAASSNSRLFHVNSPFYLGKTMYGGAAAATAAYSRRDLNMHSALRVPVQMRPTSSLSSRSSGHLGTTSSSAVATATSGAPQSADAVVLSSTAKRILDLMNQYSSPLQEARKIGSHLSSGASASNLPGLVQQRTRFSEEDVKLSRSIRLNTPRTPYSRPLASGRDPDASLKLLATPNTNELQVPQISQLLKMKRLQHNTEQVRQMAATSKSSLNKEISYRLPTDSANALGEPVEQVKQQSKMKTKVSKTRAPVRDANEEAPEVALPDIRLPVMKTMPSFGLTAPAKVTTPPAFGQILQESPAAVRPPQPSVTVVIPAEKVAAPLVAQPATASKPPPTTTLETNFKFSSPLTDISTYAGGVFASNNFKFSDPILSAGSVLPSISNDSLRKSNANTLPPPPVSLQQPFTFDPSTAKLKEPTAAKLRMLETPQPPPTLKSGSVLDFLKASSSASASPTGDAGFKQLLAAQNSKWECASCMTRNDNKATKCLCCETPKAGKASSEPNQSMFKLPAATGTGDAGFKNLVAAQTAAKWECSSCLTRNENAVDKCLCCSQAKAGASAPTITSTSFGVAPPMDAGFKGLVAAQSAKWECASCMTRNDNSAAKCLCCEAPKPGGSGTTKPLDSGFKSLVAAQSAKWECTACMTRNENSRSKCVCCEQAKPGAASDNVPQFSFGAPAASKFTFGVLTPVGEDAKKSTSATTTTTATTTNSAAPATGGFTFGAKAASSEPKPAGGFTFGNNSASTPKEVAPPTTTAATTGGFSFGAGLKPATESKGFSLGSSTKTEAAAVKSATSGFTFGAPASAAGSKDTIDITKVEMKPSSAPDSASPLAGFKFGQSTEVKKESPAPVATTASAPVVQKASGTFNFGSSPASVTTTAATSITSSSALPSNFVFGSSSASEPKNTSFSFSTPPKPAAPMASTSLTPSTATFGSPKVDSGFSFGGAKPTFAASQAAPPSITPTFGSTFGEKKPEAAVTTTTTTTSGFGALAGAVKDDQSKGFGAFAQSKPLIFGAPAAAATITTTQPQATSTTATPFVFGSKPEAPTFSFGSNATTSQSSGVSLFGAAAAKPATQQPVTATFGSGQPSAGGFQSFSSFSQPTGATTPQQPMATPTFGTFGSPASSSITPTFGSTAAASASAPTSSLPAFGSAGGFGSGASVFGSGGSGNVSSSAIGQPSPFSVPVLGSSSVDEPTTKKFNFGGQPSAGGSFVFGSGGAGPTIGEPNKPAFNFTSNAPQSSFDFTNGNQGITSATPFAFGGNPSHTGPQFQMGGMPTETTPNNAFQFSASNNPFAAQPSNLSAQQNAPRRKIKATRRLRQ